MQIDEEEQHHSESLHYAALRREEARDENHKDFAEHYHTFPVISSPLVAVVEKTQSLFRLDCLQSMASTEEQEQRCERGSNAPNQESRKGYSESPLQVRSVPAL